MEVNGVEFEEEEYVPRRPTVREVGNRMAAWLMKNKIAKTPIQANGILLIVILVCVIAGIVALIVGDRRPVGPSPAQQTLFRSMNIR